MSETPLPPWPAEPLAFGSVVLRAFADRDVAMVTNLATDPYMPLIGTIPAGADEAQARDWIRRQHRRWDEGAGFSFAIATATAGQAVGAAGLWLAQLPAGRATAGYSIAPNERGCSHATHALTAMTDFAWTLTGLHRVELHIEPWNIGSIRTAERAGYEREGLMRSHQTIGGQRRDMLLYAAVRA